MPELPDLTVYAECLHAKVAGTRMRELVQHSPFLLRTVEPAPARAVGQVVAAVDRLGKQLVVSMANGIALVLHLMIAGRLHWHAAGSAPRRSKVLSAELAFDGGVLAVTEASAKKRASLRIVEQARLAELDRGGVEPLRCTPEEFAAALRRENRTVKRALTDPRLVSGIGNAYSDEILHAARVSPVTWTTRLDEEAIGRLHAATREELERWTERLRRECADGWPRKVTAFRPDMAVHGRYGKPCPDCTAPVQRIRYATNECNYCPRCQTGGTVLADRSLSRLLRGDWPRTLEELDEFRSR